jgi:hypothetical protein
MMERLLARGRALGEARAAALADAIVAAAADELPGLAIERIDGGIGITGHGLARRLAFDARLAFLGRVR